MTKACEETKHFYSDHSQPGTCMCVCVCFTTRKVRVCVVVLTLLHDRYTRAFTHSRFVT